MRSLAFAFFHPGVRQNGPGLARVLYHFGGHPCQLQQSGGTRETAAGGLHQWELQHKGKYCLGVWAETGSGDRLFKKRSVAPVVRAAFHCPFQRIKNKIQ